MAPANDPSQDSAPLEERIKRLEEIVHRVLNLQRLDDLTIGGSLLPSGFCTHSGTSNGCSTKSIGCDLSTKPVPTPTPAG
jgi:hypothetical protein